jgi:pimeloyl-ACP methyl ester carboxylesterase
MPTATANGIELAYETMGDPADPTVLLVMGWGAQMTLWPDEFCKMIVDRGYHVVRFDNRDVGLSAKTEGEPPNLMAMFMAAMAGQQPSADSVPYTLSDMAADAVALLDVLGLDRAHVVGASMGGMIAQTIAIEHPERTASLTSIMSTTGDRSVGQAKPEVITALLAPAPQDREEAIERSVAAGRMISGPHFDEERSRELAAFHFDRCFHPVGLVFQMAAILASGDRTDALASVSAPTTVIHGRVDPLVTLSGGEATAKAIPGAELVVIDDMGHDLPMPRWPEVVDAIDAAARR